MEVKFNLEPEVYCCECALIRDALDTLGYVYKQKSSDYASVAILCNEDLTEKIVKSLNVMCAMDNIDLGYEYFDFDRADYDKEYGICLIIENGQLKLSVEKAIAKDDDYKLFDLDYVYISEDCDDKLIKKHVKLDMDVFYIDGECEEDDSKEEFDSEFECDGDCKNCDACEEASESVPLYDVVEGMVKSVLEDIFSNLE